MTEGLGVLAAMLSSALGGASIGATRFIAHAVDPLTLGVLRFGIGVVFLAPVAWLQSARWPARADWPRTVGLGLLFFALFPALFNASLRHTTAARGALALSTLPLLTMAIGAALGVEPLTRRKVAGVALAVGGVAFALLSGLSSAPAGAWRGDALMVAAALAMAFYSVWSRPVIRRSSPIAFTAAAMAAGAVCLIGAGLWRGGFAPLAGFDRTQWLAVGYLGVFGAAITFFLWAYALSRTTPTLVAVSVTVNPIAAAIVGTLLIGEPLGWSLVAGLAAVLAGISIATSAGMPKPPATSTR